VQYVIGNSDLERVNVINDLGVLVDSRMTFVNHIESIVVKSARMLGFIKRISREFNDPYTYKTLYVALVRFIWRRMSVFKQIYKICIVRSWLDYSASTFL
jgi:hypothetical protein